MPPSAQRLAQRVRRRRTELGLTQLEVAIAVGVAPTTIYWLERDGRHSTGTLARVAEVLECHVGDLTG